MTENGLITIQSAHDVASTVERLVSTLESKGVTIYARIDHAAELGPHDRPLRPSTVVLFGNPAASLPLMRISQSTAIDLPMKVLIWQDAKGAVQYSYNDPSWIASRHHVGSQGLQTIRALSAAMSALGKQVTAAKPVPVEMPAPMPAAQPVAQIERELVPAE